MSEFNQHRHSGEYVVAVARPLAAAVVISAALVGCGTTTVRTVTVDRPAVPTATTAPSATTVAANAKPSASAPGIICIDSKGYEEPEVEPTTCLIRPPDGAGSESVSLADLHWSSWGATSATATGEALSSHGQPGGSGLTSATLVASNPGRDLTTGNQIFTKLSVHSAATPHGYTAEWLPPKPSPRRETPTTTTCASGIVASDASCAFAAEVGATFIKDEGEHDSSIELTVAGHNVNCHDDSSADGHFGDITCTDSAGASVEFAVYATESGGGVAGAPKVRAPESSTQREICSRLYREYQEEGEGSAAAIQEYGKDGCQ